MWSATYSRHCAVEISKFGERQDGNPISQTSGRSSPKPTQNAEFEETSGHFGLFALQLLTAIANF